VPLIDNFILHIVIDLDSLPNK